MNQRIAFTLCALGLLVALGSVAEAQEQGSVPVQQFVPMPGGDANLLTVSGANALSHANQSAGLYLNYARHPLVLRSTVTDESVAVVANQLQMDVVAALGLFEVLELGVGVPVTLFQNAGDSASLPTENLSAVAAGDIRLYPKWSILPIAEGGGPGFSLVVPVTLPSGSTDSLQGNASVTVEPKVAFEFQFPQGMRFSANVGYVIREQQAFRNIDVGNEFTYGAGYQHPIIPGEWSLIAEVYGKTSADPDIDQINVEEVPLEGALAARWHVFPEHAITFGLGPGLTEGYGSPQVRAFAGYTFTDKPTPDSDGDGLLDNVDACPFDPEDFDKFADQDGCPDEDDDGDGVCDAWVSERDRLGEFKGVCEGSDECRMDPEDKDNFEDENGCPDPDNDQDTVLDVADACMMIPEDADGHEDSDGCPEPDNDGDGICDAWVAEMGLQDKYADTCTGSDQCRDIPEDPDDVEDEDGCPELDNDKDFICDPWAAMWVKRYKALGSLEDICAGSDQCPLEPENLNDVEDDDGCPDKSRRKVEIAGEKLIIKDKIYFDFDKATIKRRSFKILNDVAEVLDDNPQLGLIEIQGHTDDVGKDGYNKRLSQKRADSVLEYLTTRARDKIAADRLRSKGYGEEVPLVPFKDDSGKLILKGRDLKKARDSNRRVEFLIINRGRSGGADKKE